MTNSLIVTQHNNSNKKIENIPNNAFDIPKNIIKSTTANHKKSKSQGAVKNHNSVSSNSITAQALIKKYPLPIGSYKTSQEFFDPRQKRGK